MKILAVMASGRKQGNTARIVQMIAARLEALAARAGQPLTFHTLSLADMDIQPYRGAGPASIAEKTGAR
jgi:hypothetical protein